MIAATVITFVVAIPFDIGTRSPYAYNGSDWAQVSSYVHTIARPDEAVVFDDSTRPSLRPRLALRMYPAEWRGIADLELTTPYNRTSWLWDRTASLDEVAPRLDTVTRVLAVELEGSRDQTSHTDVDTLEDLGFTLRHTRVIDNTVIYQLTRGES